jgi:hypothetical protein
MNRRNFVFLAAALAMVVATALFYIAFNRGSDGGLASATSETRAPAPATRSIVRSDQIEGKKSGYVPVEVNPDDYTTAPKPHTVEGRLVKLWSDRQLSDSVKAERFLTLFHELSDSGKKIAIDYATQLITDEDYLRQRPRLLRMANTDELREVVMLDMLTREDGIKMPSLVELMKSSSQTTRSEVREILEAFLEKDYGDDLNQWDAAVRQWVAENQDI